MVRHRPKGALPAGSKATKEAADLMVTDKPVPRPRYVQLGAVPISNSLYSSAL